MGNVRIDALREQMKDNNIDVYYLNTSDYHMSEYVPLYFKTIDSFSGFSGSLATLLVDLENYAGKVIGLDGKRTSINFAGELNDFEIVSKDIYSSIIENRASLSTDLVYELGVEYTGLSRKKKLDNVKYILDGKTHIVNNLESISYILNLRGNDILCTPVFLAYLVFNKNDVYFFIIL